MKWEEELGSSREIPNFEEFLKFLENRFRTLEMIEVPMVPKEKETKKQQKALYTKSNNINNSSGNSNFKPHSKLTKKPKPQKSNFSSMQKTSRKPTETATATCAICKQSHHTAQCNSFKNNTAQVRRQLASQYNLCSNCLGSSHTIDVCYSTKTCIFCKQNHHSLLHIHENLPTNTAHLTSYNPPIATAPSCSYNAASLQHQQTHQSNSFYASSDYQGVRILGTALIRIVNASGYAITARALLDSGADDNYITNAAVQSACLHKYPAASAITGLNDVTVGATEFKANFTIESLDGSFQYDSSAAVVDTITSKMPAKYVDSEQFGFLNNLPLADPNFNHPGKIQLLLGVGFIVRIRKPGLRKFKDLMAEQTLLGWVVMGQCSEDSQHSTLLTRNVFLSKSVSNVDLSKQIQKFFEIEEFTDNKNLRMPYVKRSSWSL